MNKKIILLFFTFVLYSKFCYSENLKDNRNVYNPKISASEAITIVKKTLPDLKIGEVIVSKGKSGVKSLDVIITKNDKKITKIRINPQTGDVLPKGYRTYYPEVLITEKDAIKKVENLLPIIKVGNPWLGINKNWRVPLILNNTVVSEVTVNADNGEIVTNKLRF